MPKYLRTYPVAWPIFSTKCYTQDSEGWWNPIPRKRRKKQEEIFFTTENAMDLVF